MPYFRKKPVVIEAMKFTGLFENFDALCDAFGPLESRTSIARPGIAEIFIDTLEGRIRAVPGDWIIRGVKGELYPCKHEIFAETYEQVEPPPCFAPRRQEAYPK